MDDTFADGNQNIVNEVIQQLSVEYKVTDIKEFNYQLGINIRRLEMAKITPNGKKNREIYK